MLSIFLSFHYSEIINLFRCQYSTQNFTGLFRPMCIRPGFVESIAQECFCEQRHRLLALRLAVVKGRTSWTLLIYLSSRKYFSCRTRIQYKTKGTQ